MDFAQKNIQETELLNKKRPKGPSHNNTQSPININKIPKIEKTPKK